MTTSSEGSKRGRATKLRVLVDPVPASRPRVSKWGVYYGKTYKGYMAACDEAIPHADYQHEGNLKVTLQFACRKPKTTKRINPRGDIDNHIKAILDAITKKGYWIDDDQVVSLHAIKRWADVDETPHTTVIIEAL